MDKPAKILELFSQCTHQEQLWLIDELALYLKRDIIGLLPTEIVEIVLSYMPLSTVLTCLSVSSLNIFRSVFFVWRVHLHMPWMPIIGVDGRVDANLSQCQFS